MDIDTLRQRFNAKWVADDNGCHLWTAALNTGGYPVISVDGKQQYAHRLAVFLATGEWPPDGMDTDHLCYVRHCVNIEHLEVVTRTENNQRRRRGWTRRKDPRMCKAGLHLWIPANLRPVPRGYQCRPCAREADRRRYYAGGAA